MLLHARAVLVQHAKIVIGELQVIFGVDAIPLHLRVTREILVFLVALIRIAPRAVVDAIATLRVALRALSATAAPEIGRAHVCTPVTNARLVCRLLLYKKQT